MQKLKGCDCTKLPAYSWCALEVTVCECFMAVFPIVAVELEQVLAYTRKQKCICVLKTRNLHHQQIPCTTS